MKIGIYSPHMSTYGGGEKYLLKIAEVLQKQNSVEFIVLQKPNVNQLETRLNVDLSGVTFRQLRIPNVVNRLSYLRVFLNVYFLSNITKEYDLFLTQGDGKYACVPSQAKYSFYISQVPLKETRNVSFPQKVKRVLANFFFDPKLVTYDEIIVYSNYVKKFNERYYGRSIKILWPPIDNIPVLRKKNIILSVGRFFIGGHCKKQFEMINAFKQLSLSNIDWEYHVVGGVTDDEKNTQYLETCKQEAMGFPVYFHVNTPFKLLKRLYGNSKIFWHATGLNEDESEHPERMEHFGITTGEAMSAGCVPIVINKGGQPEIVRHGVQGYLWEGVEELIKYTSELMHNEMQLKKMSEASIQMIRKLGAEKFCNDVSAIFSPPILILTTNDDRKEVK